MRRIKLVVAYDGTDYSGWQIQPNAVTIEQKLNEALSAVCNEEIKVTGASRTDAGVHALMNIAVFDTDSPIPADKFAYALNPRLPDDIVIQDSCETEPDFHPRRCDTVKTYEYKILNRRFPLPMMRKYTLFYHYPLDIALMNEAAGYLVGEHDFKGFCSSDTQAETTVRKIYSIEVLEKPVRYDLKSGVFKREFDIEAGREITIRVTGNGFLYNMVRIIAGTLIEAGAGKRTPYSVKEALDSCDRRLAGPTAPPHGLTLVSIKQV